MIKNIFISYASKDRTKARVVKSCLPNGYIGFLDIANIAATCKFRDAIEEALDNSHALIVLCSTHSVQSQEVHSEVGCAKGMGIPILPVFLDDNRPNNDFFPYLQGIHGIIYNEEEPCSNIILALEDIIHRPPKSIRQKIRKVGLIDISVGWKYIDLPQQKLDIIFQTLANKSELFLVGRTFMAWSRSAQGFAREIAKKSIKCRMVIADPTLSGLKSLVITDQAQIELRSIYDVFKTSLPIGFQDGLKYNFNSDGFIEIYGIPAYLPSTFTLFETDEGVKYCNLEVGIAADPTRRVPMFFKNVSEEGDDVYTALKDIYHRIVDDEQDYYGNKRLARLLFRVDSNGAKIYNEEE